jgi:hypothetical protein
VPPNSGVTAGLNQGICVRNVGWIVQGGTACKPATLSVLLYCRAGGLTLNDSVGQFFEARRGGSVHRACSMRIMG